jgi:hypothetical protein
MDARALFAPHAASFEKEILADLKFWGAVFKSFGIHWQAVLISNIRAEGAVDGMLILASFR